MWGASEFSATGTLKTYDRATQLQKIECPTLFICGEYDEASPSTAKQYAKTAVNADFVEIKNASHAILAEKPNQLIKIVSRFMSRLDTNK
jgi:proline iminopeptidase